MIDWARDNFQWLLRDLLILTAILLAMAASRAAGDSVRLLDQATTTGPEVHLRQVAELDGPEAQKLGDLVVSQLPANQRAYRVTLDAVREALSRQGVNWGLLSLRGHTACRVEQTPSESAPGQPHQGRVPPASDVDDSAGSIAVNPPREVALDSSLTVRDQLMEMLAKLAGVDRSDLKIKFADADAKALGLSTLSDRFELEPQSATGIGRVPVTIRRWAGDRPGEVLHVTAEVSRRCLAIVTTKPISRGQTFAPSDLEVREVFLDSTRGTPATEIASVAGQNAVAPLRKGAVVLAEHLSSPVVIKRGEMMTVRCVAGGMVVKILARAAEDGTLDQVIAAKRDGSRDPLIVKVTGAMEGLVVTGDTDAGEGKAADKKGAAAR